MKHQTQWRRSLVAASTPYLFLLPALLIYGVFLIYPMLSSLVTSFTDWDGLSASWKWVGLTNYRQIFADPTSRLTLVNTTVWTLVYLVVPTGLGLLLAVALTARIPGRTLLRGIFYAPGVLPVVAVGLIWAWFYNPYLGFLNETLKAAGLGRFTRGWLSDPSTALAATMVAAIWQGTGFPMLLYLAGLQAIPSTQYEAAELDGAGRWSRFRHVTLPWLRESHVVVACLAVVSSLRAFDLIYVMTYGGPGRRTQVMATWMYFNTFQYNNAGLGAAIAWTIAAVSMIVIIPYIRVASKK